MYFVQLASLTDPHHVIAAVAEHVGARLDTAAPLDALADRLGERRGLLVLDNFEHLATAATDLISFLDRCTSLQVLVRVDTCFGSAASTSSRAPLSMCPHRRVGHRKSGAVKLFLERAAAARPGFAP